jgi:serine O-acetyltransferase
MKYHMFTLFKEDVQRWVIPQQIADPAEITLLKTVQLLWRHPPLQAMALFRLGSWCKAKRIPLIAGLIQQWLFFCYGLEISPGAAVGGGLYIAHPQGTVISAAAIGRNCTIIASVTIGMRNEWAFPQIGDDVFIGAGARVLGDVVVGDGAMIGANAVVIHDVPPGTTAVGVPARMIGELAGV